MISISGNQDEFVEDYWMFTTMAALAVFQIICIAGLNIRISQSKTVKKRVTLMTRVTLTNIVINAVCLLAFRAPSYVFAESDIASFSTILCIIFHLLPDFCGLVMVLSLPLMAVETFARLMQPKVNERRFRRSMTAMLVVVYSVAAIMTGLPASQAVTHNHSHTSACNGYLRYGGLCVYLYITITALAVLPTVSCLFGSAVWISQKFRRITDPSLASKKTIIRRGIMTVFALSLILLVSVVPWTVAMQITDLCYHDEMSHVNCVAVLLTLNPIVIVIQQIGFLLLPIGVILLTPGMLPKGFCRQDKYDLRRESRAGSSIIIELPSDEMTTCWKTRMARFDAIRISHEWMERLPAISEHSELSSTYISMKMTGECGPVTGGDNLNV